MFDVYIRETLLVVLLFSAIPLGVGAVSGFVVTLFQAATQLQEQTITYVVKIGAVTVVLALCAGWISREMVNFTQELLGGIAVLGRLGN